MKQQQDYFHKVSMILHDNLRCKSLKP